MTNPFFSIVIANYNHGTFLEAAIQSVLRQSCQDFELILVDGGSTDTSSDVIEKFKDSFAWWCSEKDKGQSHAFNKGFSHARGKFFSWLNADDILLPQTLEKAHAMLSRHRHCQWLAGNTIFMNETVEILRCSIGPEWIDWISRRVEPYVYGPTAFFHSELFNRVHGFDETYHYAMDTDLWCRFIEAGVPFKRLNHFCWAFRIHQASKTSHGFSGAPVRQYMDEKIRLKKQHGFSQSRKGKAALLILKLFTAYPWAALHTAHWKGRRLGDFLATQ